MMLQAVQLSMAALPRERAWLPLLWTADYFKAASAREDRLRPWSLAFAVQNPLPGDRSGFRETFAALAGRRVHGALSLA
jgi:hypothetical protein